MEEDNLSARDVLEKVYLSLKGDREEIVFEKNCLCEIANDSDWHRIRVGYSIYRFYFLLEEKNKKWAVSFGKKGGGYPADFFDCDIAAIEVRDDNLKIVELFQKNTYLFNSLLFAFSSGEFAVREDGFFGEKVANMMPELKRFIVREAETMEDVYTLNFLPMKTSFVRYDQRIVPHIVKDFEKILFDSW